MRLVLPARTLPLEKCDCSDSLCFGVAPGCLAGSGPGLACDESGHAGNSEGDDSQAPLHYGHTFEPDSSWQQQHIGLLYARSGRRLSYLGDWHTHPAGKPESNQHDRRTPGAIAHTASARCPNPIILVPGQPDGPLQATAINPRPGRRLSDRIAAVRTVHSPGSQGWDG